MKKILSNKAGFILKEFIKKNKFNIIIMVIYSAITLITIVFHENWRDEAQSWLIARDLGFIDIFKQMKYEGHPCLWHFIIAPFAKLGFPYITENIISWIIMNLSAWLLIKKSPFSKYTKIIILATSPFAYLFPVISRSYCIIALAIVLIAITHKNRKEEPIKYTLSIVLLSFTHIIMLGLVGSLYLLFFFEEVIIKFNKKNREQKNKILLSLSIAVISLAILFFQLAGTLQTNTNVNSQIAINSDFIYNIFKAAISSISLLFGNELAYIIFIFLMITLVYEFIKFPKNALIILGSICFQLFIYSYIYSVSEQRAGTILLIIILFSWIQKNEFKKVNNKAIEILFFVLMIINAITACLMIENEIKYPYSAAKETGKYINSEINYDENSIFIGSHMPLASAVIPYTSINNFWSPQVNNIFSYVSWDEKNKEHYNVPIENIVKNIIIKYKDNEEMYFIYCYNWDEYNLEYFVQETNAVELFRSKTDIIRSDEKYIIYKLYAK